MSLATMMVHVDDDPRSGDRIRLAAQLAQRFGSTLIGITASALPTYPADAARFVAENFIEQEVRRDVSEAHARIEKDFRAAVGENGLQIEWRSDIGLPETYVTSQCRSADLLIVGREWMNGDISRSLDPAAAILRAGRPVLVVPPAVDSLQGERVLIGWKETREARRAVSDSLPLLRQAKSVTIAEICDKKMEPAARGHVEDVARYLARHGISVNSANAFSSDKTVTATLIGVAESDAADLIVTGAYGHSRLGEWFFGGVTRDLLSASPISCLMAS